ncbi:MAG: heme-binding protein [Gammaproteobacteria bacterium]|nr:heme-binding protein [Gammaproteobacteria bacterium]
MHILKRVFIPAVMAATVSPTALAADPMTIAQSRISMDVASTIATAAVSACRDKGIPIGVSVVDRNGIIQVQMRDTTAPPITLNISRKKAYTAIMFNAKGSDLESRAGSQLTNLGEGLAFMAGSVTIAAGGKIYGAVGVSGAPDGMVDEECAQAGLDAVIMDLEML